MFPITMSVSLVTPGNMYTDSCPDCARAVTEPKIKAKNKSAVFAMVYRPRYKMIPTEACGLLTRPLIGRTAAFGSVDDVGRPNVGADVKTLPASKRRPKDRLKLRLTPALKLIAPREDSK